jgi:hypothetical protein
MMATRSAYVVPGVVAAVVALSISGCGSGTASKSPSPIPPFAGGGSTAGPALYPQPGRVEYRVDKALPDLVSHALAYTLGATTSADRVAKLAGAFGVGGPVSTDASGWSATSGDFTVRVERAGGLPWTLANTSGAGTGVSGCAVAVPGSISGPDATVTASPPTPPPTCPPPTTVPGLPAPAAAEGIARSALARAGLDLSATTADVSAGPTQLNVTFRRSIGGVPLTGSPWTVAVGANGTIPYASGFLAEPTVAGDYPLAGVPVGLDRLKQGAPWIVYGGPGPVPMMGAASGINSTGGAAGTAGGSAGPVSSPGAPALPSPTRRPSPTTTCAPDQPCSVPGSPPVGPPEPPVSAPCSATAPCPTVPEAPPVVVTITGVHLGLGWGSPMDPANADAWLVPVYVFELQGGGTVSVLAVADSLLGPRGTTPPSPTVTAPGTTPRPVPPPQPAPQPMPATFASAR